MTDQARPRLVRDFMSTTIECREQDGRKTFSFPASSETPVERYYGAEVLSHANGAIRMGRIEGGAAPLLFNHDWSDPVGMITAGRVKDGRLVVDAQFFDTARAKDVQAMIDGGLRNVSIGYEIRKLEDRSKEKKYVAIDWEPLEISIVTVPADPSVGIGREHESAFAAILQQAGKPAEYATSTANGGNTMDEANKAPAVENRGAETVTVTPNGTPAQQASPLQIETSRRNAIINLAKAQNLDERMTNHWISSGASLEKVSEDVLEIVKERTKAVDASAHLDMSPKEVRQYSLTRAVRAAAARDWSKAGLELEAHTAVMARSGRQPQTQNAFFVPMDVQTHRNYHWLNKNQRDMTVAGVSGSQYLVSTQNLSSSFIDLLRNDSVVLGLGATRLTGLVGNVTIPRMTAGGTAYWLGDESTPITESQATFGQVSLTPKNVTALTDISHQLIQQSDPSVEQMVMNDLSATLALAIDVACLRGSGVSGQPQGIVGTSGVGSFDTDATDSYGDVLSAQLDVMTANALKPGCAYVADGASALLLSGRSRFANTDTPVWDGSLLSGTMAKFPCIATNQMSANTMLFGWWPSILVAEWGMLELAVNPFSDFTRGNSSIRAWYTMDTAMRYPAAFSYDSTVA